MRILMDTNIFISRENHEILPKALQQLLNVLNRLTIKILIHPKSIDELHRDQDKERKKVVLSKIGIYPILEAPPDPQNDPRFISVVGTPKRPNDYVDNAILYAIHKDTVDFLITEDRGIHKKASWLNLTNRVLDIEDALELFKKDLLNERVTRPPPLQADIVSNLNLKDPFFDSLKEEYPEFDKWFKKISREGRKCWVYHINEKSIGALLIYKVEDEPIDANPPLPKRKRLKISTLKVTHTGYKIGELFIKLVVEFSINNNLTEMYLTHFTQPNDRLVTLITEYGFHKVACNDRGEDVFLKTIMVDPENLTALKPLDISKTYYPHFYDGSGVEKYVVPILPIYHNRLFIDCKGRDHTLLEYLGQFVIEGNTIKKAYLSHSPIKKIKQGDILLFYRSRDWKALTSIGVVENVFTRLQDKEEILRRVGKRTVYSAREIEEFAKRPTLVLLFTLHFHLKKKITYSDLMAQKILKNPPLSITTISHTNYLRIKHLGGIDERFTVN